MCVVIVDRVKTLCKSEKQAKRFAELHNDKLFKIEIKKIHGCELCETCRKEVKQNETI